MFEFLLGSAQWNFIECVDYTYDVGQQYPSAEFTEINFNSMNSGMYSYSKYISPSSGTVIFVKSTTDGGISWNLARNLGGDGYLDRKLARAKDFSSFIHIFSWAMLSAFEQSRDEGHSWQILPLTCEGPGIIDFFAIDSINCYSLESNLFPPVSYVNKITNGITSCRVDSFVNSFPQQIFFPDTIVGFAAIADTYSGPCHSIYKTTDFGRGWSKIFEDTTLCIGKMYFIDRQTGFAICDSIRIIKTTDGGVSWQVLSPGFIPQLRCLYFLNATRGCAAGDSGLIINTTDAGNTWQQETIDQYNPSFDKITLFSDSTGIASAGSCWFRKNVSPTVIPWGQDNQILYPNPTSGHFTIRSKAEIHTVEIFKATGDLVFSSIVNEEQYHYDGVPFPNGVYIVRISGTRSFAVTRKLVIVN